MRDPDANTIRALRERIDELEEENRQLRDAFAPTAVFPLEWRLSAAENGVLALFVRTQQAVTKDMIRYAMAFLPNAKRQAPDVVSNLATVVITNLRTKLRLAAVEVEIVNVRGLGWRISAKHRDVLRNALGGDHAH